MTGAHVVECLHCGRQRLIQSSAHDHGDCPRCGYVGWAAAADLSEHIRRALREQPPEARGPQVTAA